MRNTKTAIRMTLKEYHEWLEIVRVLNLQRGSPTVLSGKEWYKKEFPRLLREEGIPEEEIPKLAAEFLSEDTSLTEKLAVYERKVFPHKRISESA